MGRKNLVDHDLVQSAPQHGPEPVRTAFITAWALDALGATADDVPAPAWGRRQTPPWSQGGDRNAPASLPRGLSDLRSLDGDPVSAESAVQGMALVCAISPAPGVPVGSVAQRQAEAMLARIRAEQAETEQFVAMAAHDLRAPMRNISQIAAFLRDGFIDMGDGKLEMINQLDRIAAKSSELISEVLKHAASRCVVADHRRIPLHQLCETLSTILDPLGHVRMLWPSCMIEVDSAALQIALRNLIENAIKNNDADGMTITIDVAQVPGAQDFLEFRVSDDGRGFHYPDMVFADTRHCTANGGFGLLGIKRLIEARSGTIRVENNCLGRGGSVIFRLPGRLAPMSDDAAALTATANP